MVKSLLVAAAMIVSVAAQAHNTLGESIFAAQQPYIQQAFLNKGVNWKVGDECDYKLNMGGFLNGTMVMSVASIGDDGVWLTQNLDLTIQKQEMKMLIDPNTGEIKKMLVNGQEQAVPKQDLKIVDQRQEKVTVPAGTFDSIYLKTQDNANNGSVAEQWINPSAIPVAGMIKAIQDSQLGKVTIELTSFKQ
jgi:hypothetical protein